MHGSGQSASTRNIPWGFRAGALGLPHGHWSALGNCLIAEEIAEHLAERGDKWLLRADAHPCKGTDTKQPAESHESSGSEGR